MKVTSDKLRENTIEFFNGKSIEQSNFDKKFIDYLNAYCTDLKKTEWDVLYNDETFETVYEIFVSIFIKEDQFA